jgi:large subunit ribosomal protein LX
MKFLIEGKFRAGVQWEKFSKEIEAKSEKHAREIVLSTYGSQHKVERRLIEINTVKEV